MRDYHKNARRYQRRRHRRIGLLFLLLCLLLIIFGQPLLGLLVSLAIIIILLALIAAVFLFTSRIWNSWLRQHSSTQQLTEPFPTPPEALTPYEQGYRAEESSAPPQSMATRLSLPHPYQGPSAALPELGASAESNVLTLLQMLGQLDDSGTLTDEFESQKQRMLQPDETKEATEPGSTSLLSPGTPYEEQPQAQYEQELPPMTH